MNVQHCFNVHSLLHTLFGIGLGFLFVALAPNFWGGFGYWSGVLVLTTAVIGEILFTERK